MKNLPLALISLALLAACGQRSAAQPAAQAETASPVADTAKQPAQADAHRAASYKRVLLPMIAANYAGECSAKAGPPSRAAIAIGVDGAVRAPGLAPRAVLDADVMLSLNKTAARTTGFAVGSDSTGWNVGLISGAVDTISFISGDEALTCVDTLSTMQPAERAVYPALAPFFSAAARTMKCTDGMSPATAYSIVPTATGVTIGADSFSLVQPKAGEMAVVAPGDALLTYRMEAGDGATVQLQLDPAGTLSTFSAIGHQGPRKQYTCFPEHQ